MTTTAVGSTRTGVAASFQSFLLFLAVYGQDMLKVNTVLSITVAVEAACAETDGPPYLPAQVSETDVELVLLAGLLLIRAAVL